MGVGGRVDRGGGCRLLPGAQPRPVSELALGKSVDAYRDIPKMEQAIKTARSDGTAREGTCLIINLSVLIFDQASSW